MWFLYCTVKNVVNGEGSFASLALSSSHNMLLCYSEPNSLRTLEMNCGCWKLLLCVLCSSSNSSAGGGAEEEPGGSVSAAARAA